jgi:hypothetical protein
MGAPPPGGDARGSSSGGTSPPVAIATDSLDDLSGAGGGDASRRALEG